jgi:hypothetical protein
MNQMSPHIPVIPDDAPFNAEQRAWLNGFFAGIFGPSGTAGSGMMSFAGSQAAPEPEEEFPWIRRSKCRSGSRWPRASR